ncbi:MAG TPA: aldehyde ferredoxin oxidoreductase C-terminal domain-containing protein, partial [Dissulfurispiraceae bacterium]|nr:aldehyde ferredoxin oxidoreductase C-terminal domain-containing protein [Dissulfurispiraceae bacterium]
YISIHGDKVFFRDASSLWGMENTFGTGRIIRENEPSSGQRTIMRIGSAGEKLVSYACVITETYRHFGRLGLGAVFGSKKLKAVVVSGKRSLPTLDKKEYRTVYDEIFKAAVSSPVMKKYHDLGTPENVKPLNLFGGLPTRNLRTGSFEGADKISGESFAEKYLGRRLACSHCPVGCIHIAALREPHPQELYFYKTTMISYDYELIFALGSMLGIADPEGILKLIDAVESYGIDAMSTGVILAWATEAQGRGIISDVETLGIKLDWGNYLAYVEALRYIVEQPNDFYRALAKGVDHAAAIYGGADYAMAFGRNEMAGYHTGPGAHVGFLVGARHSHLDNGGYAVDQKIMIKKKLSPEDLAQELLKEERWRQIMSSLVTCFFARGLYTTETVIKALHVAGFELTADDLDRIGDEIHRAKYIFKLREGFSFDDLRIPKRTMETMSPVGMLDEEYMRKAIDAVKQALVSAGPTPKETS